MFLSYRHQHNKIGLNRRENANFFEQFSVQIPYGRLLLVTAIVESTVFGGRYWDRTSDPCRVKAVLYR
jgi:hypothetical protein